MGDWMDYIYYDVAQSKWRMIRTHPDGRKEEKPF